MRKRILIAPLDWGLGHATRCVPMIDRFLAKGHTLVFAGNGRSIAWLRARYPEVHCLEDIPDYNIRYPHQGSMQWAMMKQGPRLMKVIRAEHEWLLDLCQRDYFDEIISDNRYGLYHPTIPCSIITHQLHVQAPWPFKSILRKTLHAFIARFDHCLIPDEREPGFAGALSHGELPATHVDYIGIQSRFQNTHFAPIACDIVAIISGPEPQRSHLQNIITTALLQHPGKHVIFSGQPELNHIHQNQHITNIPASNDAILAGHLLGAKHIICRSGYSTLMDLLALNRKAWLIPTPGQTEQEYLAQHFCEHFDFKSVSQEANELVDVIRKLSH